LFSDFRSYIYRTHYSGSRTTERYRSGSNWESFEVALEPQWLGLTARRFYILYRIENIVLFARGQVIYRDYVKDFINYLIR